MIFLEKIGNNSLRNIELTQNSVLAFFLYFAIYF